MVLGEEESVLIREVSLFQGLKSTQTWYLGRKKVSCLERCPHFRGVLIEGFHCSGNAFCSERGQPLYNGPNDPFQCVRYLHYVHVYACLGT